MSPLQAGGIAAPSGLRRSPPCNPWGAAAPRTVNLLGHETPPAWRGSGGPEGCIPSNLKGVVAARSPNGAALFPAQHRGCGGPWQFARPGVLWTATALPLLRGAPAMADTPPFDE